MKKIIFTFLILFLSISQICAGSITINKYDIEGKERIKANLSDSIFGVYKNRRLIKEVKIGDNKTVTLTDLEDGEYMLKEIQSGKGYDVDYNEYVFIIDENNQDFILNSYSKVIEGNLIINKYYGDNNDYKLDNEAIFEIYNNDTIIKRVNNSIEIKLEYGDYLIRQVGGNKCYDFINEFSIFIQQNKGYKYDLYTEKIAEIKEYEDLLKRKDEELKKKEIDINDQQNNLIKAKEEIENEKENIILLKNELSKEKEEINKIYNEIETKKEELKKQEELLLENKKEQEIKEEEIMEKEKLIYEIKEKLELLNKELELKEKNIIVKEIELEKKEENINKKEHELKKLETKKEDVLVVEVPNTSKKNYNKLISITLIVIGTLIIIYSKKKVTNH